MNSRRFRRSMGLAVALFLNIGFVLLLSHGLRFSRSESASGPAEPVLILLHLSPSPQDRMAARTVPQRPNGPDVLRPAPTMPALGTPSVAIPPSSTAPPAPTDWTLEAQRSARGLLARDKFEQQQRRKIGGGAPLSNFDASKGPTAPQRPLFTWGHQPISKGFDATIDDETHMPTLTLGTCRIVLIWVFPAFGCGLPWGKPEEHSHEGFDPRYRPNDVEVPVPMITEPEPQALAPSDSAERDHFSN